MTKIPIGIIQYGTPPIPDVGNHPRETENIKIAVIATQKSGALAAVKETTLEILSKIPFGLYAAKEPIKIGIEQLQKVAKLIEALEDDDDVRSVTSNFEASDEDFEALSS